MTTGLEISSFISPRDMGFIFIHRFILRPYLDLRLLFLNADSLKVFVLKNI